MSNPHRRIDTGGGWYTERGDVHHVQADNAYYSHGDQVNTQGGAYAGRDLYRVEDGKPYYHTLRRRGRACVMLGMLMCLTGFAMFGYVVFMVISEIAPQIGKGVPATPTVDWLPWLPLGFALFVAGIFVNGFGSMIGRRADR